MRIQLAIGFVAVLAVFVVSPADVGDGYLALPTAHSLVHDRDLDLSEFGEHPWLDQHYAHTALDGRQVDYFPWMTAAVAAPFVVAWEALSWTGAVESPAATIRSSRFVGPAALIASVLAAAAATVMALLTVRLFELARRSAQHSGRRWTVWVDLDRPWLVTTWVVVLGLGTSLWSTASRALWQHGPSMLLGATALLATAHVLGSPATSRTARWAVLAGAAGALAYWERPTNVVIAAVVLGVLVLRRRRMAAVAVAAMLLAHLGVVAANLALTGRSMPPYFAASRLGWHDALPQAAAANLVSPARGLLLFSPFVLAAALWALPNRRLLLDRDLGTFVGVAAAGAGAHLLAVAAYGEKWWAGHSFGPRFMSEALVLLAPLALVAIFGPRVGSERRVRVTAAEALAAIAIVWSVAVHLGGVHSRADECWNRAPVDVDDAPERVWDLADAQLSAGFRSMWGDDRCAGPT